MKYLLPIILFVIISCSNNSQQSGQSDRDSAYLTIDMAQIKVTYHHKGKDYEVYRVNNESHGVDTCGDFYYSAKNYHIKVFCFYDLPVGCSKNLILNTETNTFYETDWYNCTGSEGDLLYSKLDFKNLTAKYRDKTEGEDKVIKMREVWNAAKPSDTVYIMKYVPEEVIRTN